MAAGLAVAAAALASTGLPGDDPGGGARAQAAAVPERERDAVELVTAPVRIADAETVRLLRPGDRVDVVAAASAGGEASRVVAGARVVQVPTSGREGAHRSAGGAEFGAGFEGESAGAVAGSGALVVLSVPRAAATKLAGAGVSSRLAVVVC